MSELKPCPFCGDEAEIAGRYSFFARCKCCGAEIGFGSDSEASAEEAEKAWNTRAPQSQWVSVEDRLPESIDGKWSDPVIAMCDQGLVYRLSYFKSDDGNCWQRTSSFANSGSRFVTHWMQLPTPPEGDSNEN